MNADFSLVTPPVLSRAAVFRDEALRTDVARQEAGWPKARLVVVDDQGRTPVSWDAAVGSGFAVADAGSWDVAHGAGATLKTRATTGATPTEGAVLLGEADGVAYWAIRGKPDLVAGDDPSDWADLRMTGTALDALGAGLFTTAVAVLNWHDAAQFCARDGSPTHVANAGWHRHCEANGHEEYPRTDPAVICLVHDGAEGDDAQVLLARQPVWPEGRFTVLAGFVEGGESLEACVQREIHEEVGVEVTDIRYLGSQAWPFPRSLMVGFHAVADPSEPVVPADGEIAEAMWVTRAELRLALERGDWSGKAEPGERLLLLPGKVSIARSMLESWAAS
ncbi:MAG: diphosphatase [Pseudonocardiales bacterium]|uniref:NAD(+) diphosphatase n=1 Tax=Pseudonocardia sp. TaxID=60912 RepID=UPI002602A503|nr:NAD(+) diphosphatase [Pseudonocardia sp.]MCW2718640.1 diphosphatase [Pseudonocardia sp.]MDT7613946.1 diphosphatase [Pseudonocardiales bacterium]MDT7708966.1 diphosphatase [Pseudonocardiales bacterium]